MTIHSIDVRPAVTRGGRTLLGHSEAAVLDDPSVHLPFEPYPEPVPDLGEALPDSAQALPDLSEALPDLGSPMRLAAPAPSARRAASAPARRSSPVPTGAQRVARQAVRWAEQQTDCSTPPPGKTSWKGYCLVFVRSCYGINARYPDAEEAFFQSEFKHGTRHTPPPGVPVWWTNGGYGHVALSAGHGYCYSTDFRRSGFVDKVAITAITRGWGQRYRGWTEDINGIDVWSPRRPVPTPDPPPRRAVSLANVIASALADAGRPDGQGLHEHDVRIVERALRKEGLLPAKYADGYAGTQFREAYATWQKRVVGPPYDGIPGARSLKLLGTKHGFRVVD